MRESFIYHLGDRVKISETGHGFYGVTGVILEPSCLKSHGWTGFHHTVSSSLGPVKLYWIQFDEPRRSDFDDEPCEGMAVASEHLTLICEAS